jgi:hypothetical protein
MPYTVNLFSGQAQPRPNDFNVFGSGVATVRREDKAWFEGAFRYYLPMGQTQEEKMQRYVIYARKIMGIKLDPEVLWNLAPWSWAVDWFVNAGDVIHNISALGRDGLVMQYGFAMASSEWTEDHACSFEYGVGFTKSASGSSAYMRKRTYKKRIPASPYGFGLLDADLTSRQKAIIAALGLQTGGSKVH